jgi:hypothetical protein
MPVALAVAVLAVAASAGGAGAADLPRIALSISVWPKGTTAGERLRSWTLRCSPLGGTLPQARQACRRLAAARRPFAPVPREALCGAIYGGPAVALVRGTYRGRRVWTRFVRDNGCEIARWDRVRFLFPVRVDASR